MEAEICNIMSGMMTSVTQILRRELLWFLNLPFASLSAKEKTGSGR
jgi:hypothetical protein